MVIVMFCEIVLCELYLNLKKKDNREGRSRAGKVAGTPVKPGRRGSLLVETGVLLSSIDGSLSVHS